MLWKNSLTLPSLADKYFKSLGGENNEPVYTYIDPFLRNFLRNAIKAGRWNALIQYQTPEISVEVFNNISNGLYLTGNICQISEKYFEFLSKYEKKLYAKEFDLKMKDYRDINQKKKIYILTINLTCYQFVNSCQNPY